MLVCLSCVLMMQEAEEDASKGPKRPVPLSQPMFIIHSPWSIFHSQDTGPAYIRMRLPLAQGPLDPLLSQPYSISRRAGPLNSQWFPQWEKPTAALGHLELVAPRIPHLLSAYVASPARWWFLMQSYRYSIDSIDSLRTSLS